jgi:hypothetical protein
MPEDTDRIKLALINEAAKSLNYGTNIEILAMLQIRIQTLWNPEAGPDILK